MKNGWRVIWLALFFGVSTGVLAVSQDPAEIFRQANAAYRGGSYDQAISLYRSLLKQGFDKATAYYNLGNCYFKEKRLGPAILHYEKARQLKPRDRDILANLRHANGLLEYRVENKRNWYLKAGDLVMRSFTQKEAGGATLAAGMIFWASWGVLLYFRSGAPWGWRLKILFIILCVVSSAWILKGTYDFQMREAVVLKTQASVRYGPSYKDQVAFRLSEGMKVRLQKEADQWVRAALPNGETGWIPEEEIGVI